MIKWCVFHEDIAILCTYKTDIHKEKNINKFKIIDILVFNSLIVRITKKSEKIEDLITLSIIFELIGIYRTTLYPKIMKHTLFLSGLKMVTKLNHTLDCEINTNTFQNNEVIKNALSHTAKLNSNNNVIE